MLQIVIQGIVLLAAVAWRLSAADSCAVEVHVLSETPPHEMLSNILVELKDPDEKVVSALRTELGIARFCDFGFGPHSIRVGGDSCNPVTVSGVRNYFGSESHFR
jgi:hypothetical protein